MILLISLALLDACIALQNQVIPDCDLEFASHAMELLQPYVRDPLRLGRIEAILSSCNKSKMQKMTETSVLLFDNGVFPTNVMDDMRLVAHMLTDERRKRLEQLRKRTPVTFRKTIDDVSRILLNISLSGNEKLTPLTSTIGALPEDHRRVFEDFLNREATPSQMNPKAFDMISSKDAPESIILPIETPSSSNDHKDIRPRSFPIEKNEDPSRGILSNAVIRQNDMPPLRDIQDQSMQQKNTVGQSWFGIPPANVYSTGGRLIDVMTKNHRASSENTVYKGTFNAPIRAVVSNNGRPQSVGIVMRPAAPKSSTGEMEDSDLLKPGASILSHAVDFLEKAIPLVQPPPAIPLVKRPSPPFLAPSGPRYSSPYTFPFPEQPQQSSQNGQLFLPLRDDAIHSATIPVNPANSARSGTELDGYDTKLGRFAGGVANSVLLPSVPAVPVREMEPNKTPPNHTHLLPKSIRPQRPLYKTYPDHREGLFPEIVNQARLEPPPVTATTENSISWPNQHELLGKEESSTNHRTVLIENFPPPPYEPAAPRPQQTIGNDLLETDRLGSWPMGRFDKEEPRYPTPEPKRDSTTVIAVLQERTTKPPILPSVASFPEMTTTLPAFRPYIGPEQITGSHMAREIYNVRHHGKPRFVKIDLLNE
ncbi:hypothetical protein GCK32_008624 [Trichostrongylus colubriformis]|uniref:Uncharacterized protein n=1 Tax=Trichostrongylus colubriformis TaxID=6319 RepID=A0AAN8F6M6_TRICO